MAPRKVGQLKPFLIEEKREGPLNAISEATANKWQGNITANIKKEENWLLSLMLHGGIKRPQIEDSLQRIIHPLTIFSRCLSISHSLPPTAFTGT